MKITVEDILNLYDPCRDHEVAICQSLDVDDLHVMIGWQVQQSIYIKCEVDSIGVRDGNLAIWPTDEALREVEEIQKGYTPSLEEHLLTMLKYAKGNKNAQAILVESYVQQYGPLSNELGDRVKELLKDGTCEEMS